MLLSADEVAGLHSTSKSFEVRPFVFENQFIGVAASLSGCGKLIDRCTLRSGAVFLLYMVAAPG